MSCRRRKMYCGHAHLCVCVCVTVRGHMTTLLHGPGCNLGEWYEMPSSCALLGRFAISALVLLLWQHSAEREMSASACTRPMPGFKCTHLVKVRWRYSAGAVGNVSVGLCAGHCWSQQRKNDWNRLTLQEKYLSSDVNIIFFTDERIFTIPTPKNPMEWPTIRTSSKRRDDESVADRW